MAAESAEAVARHTADAEAAATAAKAAEVEAVSVLFIYVAHADCCQR